SRSSLVEGYLGRAGRSGRSGCCHRVATGTWGARCRSMVRPICFEARERFRGGALEVTARRIQLQVRVVTGSDNCAFDSPTQPVVRVPEMALAVVEKPLFVRDRVAVRDPVAEEGERLEPPLGVVQRHA